MRKTRTMQDILEDEMKRVRIKQNSKKIREYVQQGQTDMVSQSIYPNFDVGRKTRTGENSFAQTPEVVSRKAPEENIYAQPETTMENPINIEQYSPVPVQTSLPQEELKPSCCCSQPPTTTTPAEATENIFSKPQSKKPSEKACRPAWTRTEDEQTSAEADELLSFMETFDPQQYAKDTELSILLGEMKERVDELKTEPDWRTQWEQRLRDKKRKREEEYKREKEEKEDRTQGEDDDDNRSTMGLVGASVGSRGEARSVMSEKTQGKVCS